MRTLSSFLGSIFYFNEYNRDQFVSEVAKATPRGAKVLDAGAGSCKYRPLFTHCDYKTQDFHQYEGSSVGPMADKDVWSYGQIDYVCDATSIPVADGSFDVVLCTEVLEHVPEPISVVKEFSRILRVGGKLFLTAPLGSGLHQEPYHFYGGYTPYWYQLFLGKIGFEQIEIIPNGGFFKHYAQESRRFSAWIAPRHVTGIMKILLMPFWMLTMPWFRLVLPLACHFLDQLDTHRGFTVGYHVTAVRRN